MTDEKQTPGSKEPEPSHLLSLVCEEGRTVFLYADKAGLELLIRELNNLLKKVNEGVTDHTHLFSPEWGSYELTTTKLDSDQDANKTNIHHLKAYGVSEEDKRKHPS